MSNAKVETAFKDMRDRISFHTYEDISKQYDMMCAAREIGGFI